MAHMVFEHAAGNFPGKPWDLGGPKGPSFQTNPLILVGGFNQLL